MSVGRHWGLEAFAVLHHEFLEAFLEVLLLRDEGAIVLLPNLKSQEELQLTHHRHLILFTHQEGKFFTIFLVSASKYDVINIYLADEQSIIIVFSEKSWIEGTTFEALADEEVTQCIIPSPRGFSLVHTGLSSACTPCPGSWHLQILEVEQHILLPRYYH